MSVTPLAITELTPCTGLEDGGVYVDVFGTGFDEQTTVTFGGEPATNTIYYHGGKLVGVTPVLTPGVKDVTVTNGLVSYTFAAASPVYKQVKLKLYLLKAVLYGSVRQADLCP